MEEIELLEKLVEVQEMHIELMTDFNDLKISHETFKKAKIEKINNLQNEIGHQEEKIEALESENAELKKQIAELKKQYEELQQSIISVEQNQ